MTQRAFSDRVNGCLWGGAVGDAFGYAIEFSRLDQIRARLGDDGLTAPVRIGGQLIVSDDTQMTLFTLEALNDTDLSDLDTCLERIRLAYLDWRATQKKVAPDWRPTGQIYHDHVLWENRAPGNTCLWALGSGGHGTLKEKINDSKGCGGVMRVAPIGLVKEYSPAQAFELAARAAATTHGHPSGYLSAGALAAIIRLLVDGIELEAATRECLPLLAQYEGAGETVEAIHAALKYAAAPAETPFGDIFMLGEGWIGEEALAIALYSTLRAEDFRDCFIISANHDGDSDSTASIAGQLYGAWKGVSNLPEDWVRDLDIHDILKNQMDQFLA